MSGAFNVGGQRTATKKTLNAQDEPPSPKRDALIRRLEVTRSPDCGQTMIITSVAGPDPRWRRADLSCIAARATW